MGRLVDGDLFHVPIVRTQLTRSISGLFDGIKEEIELGFEEGINAKGSGAFPSLNSFVVGLNLCINRHYRMGFTPCSKHCDAGCR